jgi:hypothetical protein
MRSLIHSALLLTICSSVAGQQSAVPTLSDGPLSRVPSVAIDTQVPTLYFPDGDCWDNTTRIYDNLRNQPPFGTNEYILCPNTVYNIGVNKEGSCCDDGDFPLVGRSNTHYKCGNDGSSENNWTFVGGTQQIILDSNWFGEESTDVIIQGITFDNAERFATLPGTVGDFTFRDCIFQVRT